MLLQDAGARRFSAVGFPRSGCIKFYIVVVVLGAFESGFLGQVSWKVQLFIAIGDERTIMTPLLCFVSSCVIWECLQRRLQAEVGQILPGIPAIIASFVHARVSRDSQEDFFVSPG